MLKKFKKIAAVTALSTIWLLSAAYAQEADGVNISINGNKTNFKGTIVSDRTVVPLRSICESLGSTVLWSGDEKKITVIKNERKVQMWLEQYLINIDGHQKFIDATPQIIEGSTYVPIRFLSENLGYEVSYDANTKTVNVDTVKENPIIILNKTENSKGDVEIDIQYPQIDGLSNTKVEKRINDVLKKHVTDFKLETKDFDAEVKELRKDGFERNYSVDINYDIKYNKNGLLSVVFTNYTYTGGAHGIYNNTSYTIDLETGEVYKLDDLFAAGADYKRIINDTVKNGFKNYENTFQEFESIADNQSFYINNEGIVVYFSLYEYTPYAAGIPEFTIPYEDVINMLKVDKFKKDYSLNDCFEVKNAAQQKRIMENLDAIIKDIVGEKEVIKFVNNNIACVSDKNASEMVLAIESIQQKNILKCSEGFNEDIQEKIAKEFNGEFKKEKLKNVKDKELKEFLTAVMDKGYKIDMSEGYFYPVIDYSKYLEYSEYVSPDISKYISIMSQESGKKALDDAALIISWDEVFDRICSQEEFIIKYSSSARINEVKKLYNNYALVYLLGSNNTPAFKYEDQKLDEKLKESYNKAIEKNNKSEMTAVLKDYMEILKKNNYKLTTEVEKYREDLLKKLTK